jgi:hypothetical protein
VLAAADPSNPVAAAAQLPDTVNDLTIALQLLATASRPSSRPAYQQYEAAVQQLAAAVLQKYKAMLLRLLPPLPQHQQEQQQDSTHLPQPGTQQQQQQQQLTAALASLPPTKVAAAAFSLGVLRLYDRQLMAALEDASLLLISRGAFKPNQLGQLVQGFVYLDHSLKPDWHLSFLRRTKKHLGSMQAPQLASLAVWLMHYDLCSNSSSSSSAAGTAAAGVVQPSHAWVQAYLAAVGSNAGSFKALQLVQVLQPAAALHQQQQQVQRQPLAASSSLGPGQVVQQPGASNAGSSSGIADASMASWVEPLVTAVQQQLPELSMAHLAAALPALLVLTRSPWPQQLLQPLLLQMKLLLPGCAGKDLVAAVQAAAQLAGPGALGAREQAWCDAVLVQLHAQLPMLGPSELAGAVQAVALLRVKPYKAWVYALCQRLQLDVRAFNAHEVLTVLEGLSAVGIQLDPEVLHAFVLQIQRWMGTWDGEELGRVVCALRGMYPKVLPGRTVQHLVEELQRRQQFLALQEQQQQQATPFGRFG